MAIAPASTRTIDADTLLAHLDNVKLHEAVQGAWVTDGGLGAALLAIEIRGDRVRLWDGRHATNATLELSGGCRVSFMSPTGRPGEMAGAERWFSSVDGVAQFANSVVGERIGREVIICAHLTTFVIDETGACATHSAFLMSKDGHPLSFTTQPARCTRGANEIALYENDHMTIPETVPIVDARVGSVRTAAELHAAGLGRAADFAAARAIVDAEMAANDPLVLGLAAGGKVGDLSTVPSVIATYAAAADPMAMHSRPISLVGIVVATDLTGFAIADPSHPRLSLRCHHADDLIATATTAKVGSQIRVRGMLNFANDAPWTQRHDRIAALDRCVFARHP